MSLSLMWSSLSFMWPNSCIEAEGLHSFIHSFILASAWPSTVCASPSHGKFPVFAIHVKIFLPCFQENRSKLEEYCANFLLSFVYFQNLGEVARTLNWSWNFSLTGGNYTQDLIILWPWHGVQGSPPEACRSCFSGCLKESSQDVHGMGNLWGREVSTEWKLLAGLYW